MTVDLLLLNASNFSRQPIYPYAFVQLRAVARRHGCSVVSLDVFGYTPEARRAALKAALARHRPRMLGVHLRQADSVNFSNYAVEAGGKVFDYFPLEDTRALIDELRTLSEVPIVVGGFGFTTHAERLFRYLRPDFGVQGAPDALFVSFDGVIAGEELGSVANLIHWRSGGPVLNPREYPGPLDMREYDDAVVDDMERFYGSATLYGADPPTVAVELARGCPYRCYFCTEPGVKGTRVRARPLEVVCEEIEFLASRGLRRFWLICSELNMGSPALAQEVARRFIALNQGRGSDLLEWRAYHLPRWLSREDLELLHRSGFRGGWNDFPSFDDDNLRRTQVPFRARHVLEHLRHTVEVAPDERRHLSLFLGNAYMTPAALQTTLRRVHEHGLSTQFAGGQVGLATRVFAGHGPEAPADHQPTTYTRAGIAATTDLAHPTYYPPPELTRAAGSPEIVWSFLRYAEGTLVSSAYRAGLDWCEFLRSSTSPTWLAEALVARGPWPLSLTNVPPDLAAVLGELLDALRGDDPRAAIRRAISPDPEHWNAANTACFLLIRRLTIPWAPATRAILRDLELDWSTVDEARGQRYALFMALLQRYETNEDAIEGLAVAAEVGLDSLAVWQLRHIFYDCNIALSPGFQRLFFQDHA